MSDEHSNFGDEETAVLEEGRAEAVRRIIESEAPKRLVVAGPGTGKTYTFQEALRASGGKGLALTFIRNLVDDLRDALGDLADVFTLHGFCKHMLHRNAVQGLQDGWDYYPLLLDLLAVDLAVIRGANVARDAIEKALHDLDDSEGLIGDTVRVGNYYNAVSHTDLVYRALGHFEENADAIPSYPLVVVDEYQDFSLLETRFIARLGTKSPLLIAGDDDQALYDFKNASAQYIRELAHDDEYEVFELPYCSRCTAVVVDAVNTAIERAVANGNLTGRLQKRFECYMPDKHEDSAAHPKIICAACSVQTKKASYVGRYIARRVAEIPLEDIRESRQKGYPTVMVIGDKPFMTFAYEVLKGEYPQTQLKKAQPQDISALDGYRRIAVDEESRLGWRIILACDPPMDWERLLKDAIEADADLGSTLPDDYRERHLAIARTLREFIEAGSVSAEQGSELADAVAMSLDEVRAALALESEDPADVIGDDEIADDVDSPADNDVPTILCTSRLGAKGLSAQYVFVIGFNNGYFPMDANAITDEEVCKLLVALSRTRKECHVVSCGRFAADWLEESAFADWLEPHIDRVTVDKTYFA